MATDEEVRQVVFECLESLNQEKPADERVPIALDTKLLAEGGCLNSLELVSLVVDVEAGITERFGHAVSLTDDHAMSRENSPYLSVASLCDYIVEVLSECGDRYS